MKNDLKLFALVPVYGAAGAAGTALMWQIYAATLMRLTPPSSPGGGPSSPG